MLEPQLLQFPTELLVLSLILSGQGLAFLRQVADVIHIVLHLQGTQRSLMDMELGRIPHLAGFQLGRIPHLLAGFKLGRIPHLAGFQLGRIPHTLVGL